MGVGLGFVAKPVVQVVLGINLTHVGRKVVYFFFLWVRIIKDVIEVLWHVPFFFCPRLMRTRIVEDVDTTHICKVIGTRTREETDTTHTCEIERI